GRLVVTSRSGIPVNHQGRYAGLGRVQMCPGADEGVGGGLNDPARLPNVCADRGREDEVMELKTAAGLADGESASNPDGEFLGECIAGLHREEIALGSTRRVEHAVEAAEALHRAA